MVPKVMLLQSGERIITGLAEVTDQETGKGVGLVLRCPYILSMVPTEELDDNGNPVEYRVNFEKWFAYSTDIEYRIPYSAVVAIGDPEPGILNIYLEKFGALLAYDQNTETPGEYNNDTVDSTEE